MIINQNALTGLYKALATIYNEAFANTPSFYQKIAMIVESETRENVYAWLGDFPSMREWLGDRVIKDLEAFTYTIVNKDFETTIEVDRNDIEDDQIGLYQARIKGLAQAAKRHRTSWCFSSWRRA